MEVMKNHVAYSAFCITTGVYWVDTPKKILPRAHKTNRAFPSDALPNSESAAAATGFSVPFFLRGCKPSQEPRKGTRPPAPVAEIRQDEDTKWRSQEVKAVIVHHTDSGGMAVVCTNEPGLRVYVQQERS